MIILTFQVIEAEVNSSLGIVEEQDVLRLLITCVHLIESRTLLLHFTHELLHATLSFSGGILADRAPLASRQRGRAALESMTTITRGRRQGARARLKRVRPDRLRIVLGADLEVRADGRIAEALGSDLLPLPRRQGSTVGCFRPELARCHDPLKMSGQAR